MDSEQGLRRSRRQSTLTQFFTPHYDESYTKSVPRKEKEDNIVDEDDLPRTSDNPGPSNKRKATAKAQSKQRPKRAKKQKIDIFELESDDENDENEENLPSAINMDTAEQTTSSQKGKQKAAPKKTKAAPKKTKPAPKKKPATKKPRDVPAGPKKRKTKYEKITAQLKALGVKPSKVKGNCARAAIYRGSIKLTGNPSDLDQVVLSGTLECGHECNATLRDLLEQPDYAGIDYENGAEESPIICEHNNEVQQCGMHTYVTGICSGNPSFDSGKFHNHCTKCKNFGKCIGDYRSAHCKRCGKHYWAGLMGDGKCSCRERGFGGGFGRRGGGDCVIS